MDIVTIISGHSGCKVIKCVHCHGDGICDYAIVRYIESYPGQRFLDRVMVCSMCGSGVGGKNPVCRVCLGKGHVAIG